ncbi:TonB family protein [Janthinobacterium sp.]|uniref:TonB family protein n=1 Tax=Janthinobacterium sp. TaxID=1871054 RepID=UPI00293D467C|nr:TonB family protein [Janthinobacterium sp.]
MGSRFCTPSGVMLAVQLALWGAAVHTSTAFAQLVPSVGAASAPTVDPMERAQRQADNVMRWIKVHSDKPRATAAAPAKPSEPAPPATAKAPAPTKPITVAAAAPAPTAEPAKAVVAAPPEPIAPVVAPAAPPAVVAKAPEPPPPAADEEETPLKALAQAQPVIPRNVLASLTAGKVMVKFTVEANGSVSNAEVLSSSSRQLNKPTLAAITAWRFEPIKTPRVAQVEFDFTP